MPDDFKYGAAPAFQVKHFLGSRQLLKFWGVSPSPVLLLSSVLQVGFTGPHGNPLHLEAATVLTDQRPGSLPIHKAWLNKQDSVLVDMVHINDKPFLRCNVNHMFGALALAVP